MAPCRACFPIGKAGDTSNVWTTEHVSGMSRRRAICSPSHLPSHHFHSVNQILRYSVNQLGFNSPQSNTELHGVYLIFNVIQSGTECSEGSRGIMHWKIVVDAHEIFGQVLNNSSLFPTVVWMTNRMEDKTGWMEINKNSVELRVLRGAKTKT